MSKNVVMYSFDKFMILRFTYWLYNLTTFGFCRSDEEDNDKENVNPRPHDSSNLPSLERGDPVKAFVDDEAEEEDDSDHDMRFQDEEEDEDSDSEELKDMIATAYEENPLDNERRNELHQKWLEQQDAAGTEDLLQKLKCGSNFSKPVLLEDENNEGENDDLEFCETAEEDLLPLNVARMNIRKVKQMLPQMYTDEDDQYMSDDEETERRLARELIFDKAVRFKLIFDELSLLFISMMI